MEWFDRNMGERGDPLNRDLLRPALLAMLGDLSDRVALDCGCASGYFSRELAEHAAKVVATDFSPGFVALCRERHAAVANLEFVEHDLLRPLPFPSDSVDVVVCKMVLQYVAEISTFAGEVARVLRAPGPLVIAVDHPFHAQYAFARRDVGCVDARYKQVADYFDERRLTKLSLWGRVELTWFPRTVSAYVQPFLDAGLSLSELREIPLVEDGVRVPRLLLLRFRKPGIRATGPSTPA